MSTRIEERNMCARTDVLRSEGLRSPRRRQSDKAPTGRRVTIVDDHELLARGLTDQLRASGHQASTATIAERAQLLEELLTTKPDLIVLDMGLPVVNGGLGLIGPLTEAGLRVAILTGSEDRLKWARCIDEGAEVVLAKSEPLTDILGAVDRLLAGESIRPRQRPDLARVLNQHRAEAEARRAGFENLSRREQAVLKGLVAGRGTKEIADRDSVSVATVRSQVKSMLAKLGVNSQLAAVARAKEAGWSGTNEPIGQPTWPSPTRPLRSPKAVPS